MYSVKMVGTKFFINFLLVCSATMFIMGLLCFSMRFTRGGRSLTNRFTERGKIPPGNTPDRLSSHVGYKQSVINNAIPEPPPLPSINLYGVNKKPSFPQSSRIIGDVDANLPVRPPSGGRGKHAINRGDVTEWQSAPSPTFPKPHDKPAAPLPRPFPVRAVNRNGHPVPKRPPPGLDGQPGWQAPKKPPTAGSSGKDGWTAPEKPPTPVVGKEWVAKPQTVRPYVTHDWSLGGDTAPPSKTGTGADVRTGYIKNRKAFKKNEIAVKKAAAAKKAADEADVAAAAAKEAETSINQNKPDSPPSSPQRERRSPIFNDQSQIVTSLTSLSRFRSRRSSRRSTDIILRNEAKSKESAVHNNENVEPLHEFSVTHTLPVNAREEGSGYNVKSGNVKTYSKFVLKIIQNNDESKNSLNERNDPMSEPILVKPTESLNSNMKYTSKGRNKRDLGYVILQTLFYNNID